MVSYRPKGLYCVLLVRALWLVGAGAEVKHSTASSADKGTPATVQLVTNSGFSVVPNKDAVNKRNVKVNDLSSTSSVAAAKSYDPPPEFYRGPGSTSSSSNSKDTTYNTGDSATAGFISKPISFPDTQERNKYGLDSNKYLPSQFNSWQFLRGPQAGGHSHSIQDRISVGHYGSPHRGTGVGYGSSGVGDAAGGYTAYEARPYAAGHQHVEYIPSPGHYGSSGHGGSSYYGAAGAGVGHGGASSAEGIPFDVYGNKGHYAGAGGEYSYSSYPEHEHEHGHEVAAHKGHPDYAHKVLLAKSFLIPLASAAVLGIAAALVTNPLLLQLGTVTAGVGPAVVGKRKRRALSYSARAKGSSLSKENSHVRAYRFHRQT